MKGRLPDLTQNQDYLRNRHIAITKHALGPSPETYSLDAMQQEIHSTARVKTHRSFKFGNAPRDFFAT